MYLFSKKYDRTIQADFIRKTNILNYQKVCLHKGDFLSISSSLAVSRGSGQQGARASLVNKALVLEVLSLKKAFFKFEVNKTHNKKKKTYVSTNTRVFLKNKVFFYNFSKNTIGLLKNLQTFYLNIPNGNLVHVEADALLPSTFKNSAQSFANFLILPTPVGTNGDRHYEQKLSFYKVFL